MKNLDDLVLALEDIFLARLISVFVFGSKANSNEHSLKSNVDLFIIVEKLRSEDLTKAYPKIQKWIALKNPRPIIMTKEEFLAMGDIYSIEYSDIKWNYQIVYGENLIDSINVNYFDLRPQCERELKNIIMKHRGFYLENGRSKSAIKAGISPLARSLVVIFRAILRLKNITPSVYKLDVVEQLSKVLNFDSVFFKKLFGQKEGSYNLSSVEIFNFNEYLLIQLESILKQLSEI